MSTTPPKPPRLKDIDPLDEIISGEPVEIDEDLPEGATPWDYGPAETSAVEVTAWGNDHDALPLEATPVPAFDREPLFVSESAPPSENVPVEPALRPAVKPKTEPAVNLSADELLRRAKDRYALHDFEGALENLEKIDPPNEESIALLKETREHLEQKYAGELGDLDSIPEVLLSDEEVIWLNLNHRAGYILSQIDGRVSYDDLVALSGMPKLDTLRIVHMLIREKVISTSRRTKESKQN